MEWHEQSLTHSDILALLRENDPVQLAELYSAADRVRRTYVGDDVHLRGLIEFSNHCVRSCTYCGLRVENKGLGRYRMDAEEILFSAREAQAFGYGTVVLQSGEDQRSTKQWVADLVRRIRSETELSITLSLGERTRDELAVWREAGAERYLLRFETSNAALYRNIHPSSPGVGCDRFEVLRDLRELGYEVGSGVMIGIPGQTYDDLARDIVLFRELNLDMIGVGPWIGHPGTPLSEMPPAPSGEQAPNSEEMTTRLSRSRGWRAPPRIFRPPRRSPR